MKGYQIPEVLFMPLPKDILTISQPYGEDIEEWGNPLKCG